MRWFRKNSLFIALMVVLLFTVVGCSSGKPAEKTSKGTEQKAEEKIKVGFIYIGPVGDAGWTYAHDLGRKYLEEKLPYVETTYIENVPESADAERVMTELAQKGYKIIFATSFGYMDYMLNVAKKFPDVIFMHNSGFKTAENMGTYFGRMYQPRYLSGIIAGKMTKVNKIGYVAAHPIPEVIRGINAFTLGVRSVNPNATVKVVWTNTWYDPAAEKEAAKGLLDAGVDVIAQHQDTPGPQQAAEEKGVYAIGYNTDMSSFAPKANLTSPIWNWGPYYVKVVEAVKNGTWTNEQYWGGMADNVVDLAPINSVVPEDVKKLVEEKKQAIINGEFDVFWGPIKDQSGQVKVAEGQKMTDAEMLSFDWFVEGVDGTIPK
ncbi:BMP family ABC transporter substrate-binding protein [Zhaonella formicivorans]|uniref:BMP family ABC transporter substrate-binding protein n=1 Tax=Zhaonella formicivorans TaxID=2528593 RepID=UPI0010D11E2B|nr:BMP family ABC transporter substrate-binding protein [Zhaonella formicivorans]